MSRRYNHDHYHRRRRREEDTKEEIEVKVEEEKKPCDISNLIGELPFVIHESGVWKLSKNMIYEPTNTEPAIRISVSNVTLDFKGHTLSQINKDVLGIAGIVVDAGLSNVTIRNGTVRDFSTIGIQAGRLWPENLLSELAIYGINSINNGNQMEMVSVPFQSMGGVVIFNAQNVIIENTSMNQNFMHGLAVNSVTNMTINNSHCNNTKYGFQDIPGFGRLIAQRACALYNDLDRNGMMGAKGTVKNITIRNSTFNNTVGPVQVKGIFILAGNDILIDSCEINGTSVVADDPSLLAFNADFNSLFAYGIQMVRIGGTSVRIINCEINSTGVTVNPSSTGQTFSGIMRNGIEVYGIHTSMDGGTMQNVQIDRCQINGNFLVISTPINNAATPGYDLRNQIVDGVRIVNNTNNTTISNCISNQHRIINNSGTGITFCTTGFSTANTNSGRNYFVNCQSTGNSNIYNDISAPTSAIPSNFILRGFSLGSGTVVENCFSGGHRQAAPNLTESGISGLILPTVVGFYTASPNKPIIVRNCQSIDNTDTFVSVPPATITGGLAAGFLDDMASSNFVFENCIAEANISVSGSAGTAGFGFYISGLSNSKIINCQADKNNIGIFLAGDTTAGNIISGNTLIANTLFGIRDSTNNTTNSYYNNRAKNNGATPQTTNFSIPGWKSVV